MEMKYAVSDTVAAVLKSQDFEGKAAREVKQKLASKLGVSRHVLRLLRGHELVPDEQRHELVPDEQRLDGTAPLPDVVALPWSWSAADDGNALCRAAAADRVHRLEELLNYPIHPDTADELNWPERLPLHDAVSQGSVASVTLLLTARANVDSSTRHVWSPLTIAVHLCQDDRSEICRVGQSSAHVAIVALLVAAKADTRKRARGGHDLAGTAAGSSLPDVVALLRNARSSASAARRESGCISLVRRLLAAKELLDDYDGCGEPPVRRGDIRFDASVDIVKCLLPARASPHRPSDDAETPLVAAAQWNLLEVSYLLLEAGATLKFNTEDDWRGIVTEHLWHAFLLTRRGETAARQKMDVKPKKAALAAAAPAGGKKGKGGKGGKGGKTAADPAPSRKLEAHLAATESLSEVIVHKLDQDPWPGIPAVHPLVPLSALSRVKDRQQICVAVTVAAELAEQQPGSCLLLYQVLISKRKDENSWEIGAGVAPLYKHVLQIWLRQCAPARVRLQKNELAHKDNCRMSTEIPVKDWIGCAATPSSLSALVGAIVPGQLRKLETAHPTEPTEKRFAVRLTLADSNCQCTVVLYHELVLRAAADMNLMLPEGLQGSAAVRLQLRDIFRAAQWLCRFTFRENDYQQTLELECRHLTPCLRVSKQTVAVDPAVLGRQVLHCQLNTGCPVAPLDVLQVDAQLGLISVGAVDASFVRCLVAFNDVQLPDDEALQQDNTSSSAMRVKRCVDCLLSASGQAKLRCAGPASAVHMVVLAHTTEEAEWNVLWHVPVEEHRVDGVKNFLLKLYLSEVSAPQTLSYDQTWTPQKRLASVLEHAPEETSARGAAA
eukprot:s1936_g19.t1